MNKIRAIDLFCGAGGSSWGAVSAGIEIVAGFDKWETAGEVYKDNFPNTTFYSDDLGNILPQKLKKTLGKIDLILASPECTNHSLARGGKPKCKESQETAFHVIRFAKTFDPRWIVIENVVSMRRWDRYQEFLDAIKKLGYYYNEQVLDSSDFGVPQTRRRLFIICDKHSQPPEIKPTNKLKIPARRFICMNGEYPFNPLRKNGRAKPTIERAKRAISILGNEESFLIVYYGSDRAGGWQTIDRPLRTITTLDRFAFVKSSPDGHIMRMLQPEELKLAMGWPKKYNIAHGSRRERIRMIGNAVCPKVMKTLIIKLISNNN